jgi:hypothetical protein
LHLFRKAIKEPAKDKECVSMSKEMNASVDRLYWVLRVCFEVRMLDATLLETINNLSTNNNVLHGLVYFPAEVFGKEVVGL